ncbi:MAG: hypothetical protein WD669_06480 [Pirellulales bacterium]
MSTQEITIRVDPGAAAVYLSASEQERRKLDALLSLRLSETALGTRPLQEIIRDASREAQANGLTPEILQEILDGK